MLRFVCPSRGRWGWGEPFPALAGSSPGFASVCVAVWPGACHLNLSVHVPQSSVRLVQPPLPAPCPPYLPCRMVQSTKGAQTGLFIRKSKHNEKMPF